MKQIIFSNIFIVFIILFPLLIKTAGLNCAFAVGLVNGLGAIFIFLAFLNCVGLICLKIVSKYSTYIDTVDLLEQNKENETVESHIAYKIFKYGSLALLFLLLLYNRMFLTTIFACIWRLSNQFFKINFDKFMKDIE